MITKGMKNNNISQCLASLQIAQMFAEHGRLSDLIDTGFISTDNEFWEWYYEITDAAMCCIGMGFIEEHDVNTWYFSDDNIMEYYRLCRTYSAAHKIKLQDNPFMQQAELAVESAMDLGHAYGFGWWLNTKINHKWASGIVLRTDSYFRSEIPLIGALLDISS